MQFGGDDSWRWKQRSYSVFHNRIQCFQFFWFSKRCIIFNQVWGIVFWLCFAAASQLALKALCRLVEATERSLKQSAIDNGNNGEVVYSSKESEKFFDANEILEESAPMGFFTEANHALHSQFILRWYHAWQPFLERQHFYYCNIHWHLFSYYFSKLL